MSSLRVIMEMSMLLHLDMSDCSQAQAGWTMIGWIMIWTLVHTTKCECCMRH